MNVEPSAADFIRGGNYTQGMGAFTYWTGSFKDAIKSSQDGVAGSPFESVRTNALYYQDTSNYGDDTRIKLDNRTFGSSSWVSFTLKPGWQALFYVKTENNDFFEDNVQGDHVKGSWNDGDPFVEELEEATDQLSSAGYPSIWVQDNAEFSDSRAIFTLDGNNADYISFDIDADSPNVGQARIRIDGDQYIQNKKINNEVFITMVWLRKWNPQLDLGGDDEPLPPVDPDPEPPTPAIECPVGFEDNGFGICVPIEEGEDEDDGEEDDGNGESQSIDDVSLGGIIILLVAIGGTLVLAVRA